MLLVKKLKFLRSLNRPWSSILWKHSEALQLIALEYTYIYIYFYTLLFSSRLELHRQKCKIHKQLRKPLRPPPVFVSRAKGKGVWFVEKMTNLVVYIIYIYIYPQPAASGPGGKAYRRCTSPRAFPGHMVFSFYLYTEAFQVIVLERMSCWPVPRCFLFRLSLHGRKYKVPKNLCRLMRRLFLDSLRGFEACHSEALQVIALEYISF